MAQIRTFARIRPAEALYDDFETTRNCIYLRIPDSYSRDTTLYNRTRSPIVNHEFKYSQVFNVSATQEDVFNIAAKSIIDGFLDGYNGTIFAYGQTASGKTYTMQGELTDTQNKGLAPRSLTRIFSAVSARKQSGENVTVHCSFLEIYQEVGYDLLKTASKTGPGQPTFAKVTVVDGAQGAAVVKNLSIHSVSTEEAAQNLLAQGELNRKVAETAMNNRSSRSHAVFTVYLSSRKGDILVRSKMHFVDLAGSERVCKTGVKGLQLSEAKYINLSLHYLEGVIIALHQDATSSARGYSHTAPAGVSKSWSASAMSKRPYSAAVDSSNRPRHIPYRNSLLTMLLKDSLGGNCLTTMIATISFEAINLSESISTCRFAQRVSCISNRARKNEEIDDKSMIKRLRTRVAELEAENNLLKLGGQPESSAPDELDKPALTAEDKELCQNVVKEFLNGKLLDPILAGVTDPFKFRECMSILKRLIKEGSDKSLRLAEKLKRQPSHIQEAFYTGGRYHEAPLAKPNTRQHISFRDDANALARNAYQNWNNRSAKRQRAFVPFKPTILKPSTASRAERRDNSGADSWQLQIQNDQAPSARGVKKQVRIVIAAGLTLTDPSPAEGANRSPETRSRPVAQSAQPATRTVVTPYERKRSQEVAELNKKVEASYADQLEQTNHLKAFRKTIVEQEFEIAVLSLKRKLEVTEHQLAEQHAYTESLRNTNDRQLLEQELLVERQLRKRMDKIRTEMTAVQTKLKEIQKVGSDVAEVTSGQPGYRSVNDKFSKMTRRDGTLDTVKVKTTLQQQQKMQNQIQKKIDQQRAIAIDKHLAVKEMSTRQKLEEFKRKLVESREGQRTSSHSNRPASPITSQPSSAQSSRNPSIQDQSDRDQSIDHILSKYRTVNSSNGYPPQQDSQRTAQVDKILAKYKTGGENSNPGTTKPSNGQTSVVSAHNGNGIYRPNSSDETNRLSTVSERATSLMHTNTTQQLYQKNTRSGDRSTSGPTENGTHTRETKFYENSNRKRQTETKWAVKSVPENNHRTQRRTEAWANTTPSSTSMAKTPDLYRVKLQQYLSKQYKRKQQLNSNNSNSYTRAKSNTERVRPNTSDNSINRGIAPRTEQEVKSKQNTDIKRTSIFTGGRREYSHRLSHYTQTRENGSAVNHIKPDLTRENNEELISPDGMEINHRMNSAGPPKPAPTVCYSHLHKLTKHNEHTSKVRKTQLAALKIQRAWRRFKRVR